MNKEFTFYRLNETGIALANDIAKTFNDCLNNLVAVCPAGTREFSICKTKLEEACFFAKKAMANDPSNQEVS